MALLTSISWLLFAAVTAPSASERADATPLVAPIAEVSIFRGSALVTRYSAVPAGGRFVVRGLSGSLAPDSVRLRLDGGEANAIEVREVTAKTLPEERIAAGQQRRDQLSDALLEKNDQAALATALRTRIERLLDQEAAVHALEVASGKADATAWQKNYDYLKEQLLAAKRTERARLQERDDARAALEAADAELGALKQNAVVRTFDVSFDVVALRAGAMSFALDYLVANASWTPRYDLRADKELQQVDLVYRAQVQQATGEDWKEVDVYLSTAQPQRGVAGPQARTAWLSLAGEQRRGDRGLAATDVFAADFERADGLLSHDEAGRFAASIETEGLSLRYRLARKETIESRPAASTVLVGHATLGVTGERVCTPALDPSVWVRGRTRNTSEFVMLPGRASVFFGNDFLGESNVALVRPGQEFTLHLGLDAGIAVKRTHVEDQASTSGLFSSKRVQTDRWRIELENHGALAAAADGSVQVQVREVLAKSRDDRIEVELDESTPPLAKNERFDRAREEQGVLTWEVTVPLHGKTDIDWKSHVKWPEDSELERAAGGYVGASGPPESSAPSVRNALMLSGLALLGLFAGLGALAAKFGPRLLRSRAPRLATSAALLLSAPALVHAQQVVESRIDRVTVYGRGAMVERNATLPGAGKFVVRDLPAAADPASIRVKLDGGEVVGVEVRERRERSLPDARIESLRTTVRELARNVAQLEDEHAALGAIAAHLQKLLAPLAPSASTNPPSGDARPGADAWSKEQEFLAARSGENQAALRRNAKALAAANDALAAVRRELESGEQPNVVLRDVLLDAAATGSGPLACKVSYLVNEAGWSPAYELRAAKDLATVTLTYRARVWQGTSETWRDVDLWLSTAEPQRGAEGPDPRPEWLTLHSKEPAHGQALSAPAGRVADLAVEAKAELVEREAALAEAPATKAPPFAKVANEGLSVRFHIPDRQNVEPSANGQHVLVGRSELPLAPRRSCVPEIDPTVWLSGKATNTSEWVLLPGETAVHLGNDYLGKGTLALTQKGQEFDVHLGPDPFVSVERVELEGQLETSAFSSKGTQNHAWRLRFENHGAPSSARDGAISIDVQEALPKSRDERITVRLDSARPEPSTASDDQKLRDERGILTWHISLAREAKSDVEWRWSARYPEDLTLIRTNE